MVLLFAFFVEGDIVVEFFVPPPPPAVEDEDKDEFDTGGDFEANASREPLFESVSPLREGDDDEDKEIGRVEEFPFETNR